MEVPRDTFFDGQTNKNASTYEVGLPLCTLLPWEMKKGTVPFYSFARYLSWFAITEGSRMMFGA